MQQAKFVFIICFTFLQLVVILHSSILTYVEQKYHNFTESKVLADIYQRLMLGENAVFDFMDSLMSELSLAEFLSQALDSKESPKKLAQGQDFKLAHKSQHAQKAAEKAKQVKEAANGELKEAQNATIGGMLDEAMEGKISITIEEKAEGARELKVEGNIESSNEASNSTKANDDEKSGESSEESEAIEGGDSQATKPNLITEPAPIVESYTPIRPIQKTSIDIESGSSVVLMGDSMMQGVAPYILRAFKKMDIHGINLSKHSTGLTYKNYFNFAQSLQECFNEYENISLVVVLLGANDPWTMRKNIAFKSPLWEEIYSQRIEEILEIAQSYGARVAWYEVPSVREKTLNDKILYLNSLYEDVTKANGEYFLQSNGIVTQGGKYSAFIKGRDGKSVQVRIDDGVHFTSRGYQIMANILLGSLQVRED